LRLFLKMRRFRCTERKRRVFTFTVQDKVYPDDLLKLLYAFIVRMREKTKQNTGGLIIFRKVI
jgi:hypothetical protein